MKKLLGLIFHPWLLAALGLLALSVAIWIIGPMIMVDRWRPLESESARWIFIGALVALVLLRQVWRGWKARRTNTHVVAQLTVATPSPAANDPANAEVAVLQQRPALGAASRRAVREQNSQAGVLRAQGFEQHGRRARFPQRDGMQPDQFRSRLPRLDVMAEAFFNRFQITRLVQTTACQLAAQQRLAQHREQRIKLARQSVHEAHGATAVALQASQACQTASTSGAGRANTLSCRPAGGGPVRQAVSKL